ncbi:MAG: hypothetical protein U9Q83_05265 [Bacteroidota bacterium]|nr:hypothetical protein [Bacteroidota bacterium]
MNKTDFSFVNLTFTRKKAVEHSIKFGRFSDRNKTNNQLLILNKVDKAFENKEFLEGAEYFFEFIHDTSTNNIQFERVDEKIEFSFFQGSKIIKGFATKDKLYAYSELIKLKEDYDELFEKLLNLNYNLKFSKFSLKDNKIIVELHQQMSKINSEMLYYSMRELANVADKYDDYFELNFSNIEIINKSHLSELEENEFNAKTKLFRSLLENTFKEIKTLSNAKFAGARTFILMNTLFKILFLISPEGLLLEELKRIYNFYYSNNNKTEVEKNAYILSQLKKISRLTDLELKNSLYHVTFTFPEILNTNSDKLIKFVSNEIQKMYWYESNEYKNVAQTILEYIVGHSCFTFGSLPIISQLFLIFWEIMNKEFFDDLKIKKLPFEKDKISYFLVSQRIASINTAASNIFPKFFFNIKHLNLDNRFEFAKSFMHEIIILDFSFSKEEINKKKKKKRKKYDE